MHSKVWEVLLLYGKNVLPTCYRSLQVLIGLFSTRYGCTLRIRSISPKTLYKRLTFQVGLGRTLWIQMQLARKFSSLSWVFHRCLLRSLAHSLRRENWHPSLGRIGVLWLVVSPIRRLPLTLRWSLCSCRVILPWYWFVYLLSSVYKIQVFFLIAAGCSCDNSWRNRCIFDFGNLKFAGNFWILWSWG